MSDDELPPGGPDDTAGESVGKLRSAADELDAAVAEIVDLLVRQHASAAEITAAITASGLDVKRLSRTFAVIWRMCGERPVAGSPTRARAFVAPYVCSFCDQRHAPQKIVLGPSESVCHNCALSLVSGLYDARALRASAQACSFCGGMPEHGTVERPRAEPGQPPAICRECSALAVDIALERHGGI